MNNLNKYYIGNDKVSSNILDNFKNNTLHNSILLVGPKGIGKSTLAINLLKEIFTYSNLNSNENYHNNLIDNNSHPNIRYLKILFNSKNEKLYSNISINQIRELESFLYQSSIDDLPKFVLIDSADDLNLNSANALLKILEEPKKNTYFILISHIFSSLIPTIRSRCIKFFIEKPTYDDFVKILLLHDDKINEQNINFLYSLSHGSPGLAIKILLENIDNIYNDLIEIFLERKSISTKIIQLSNTVSKFTNEEYNIFLTLLKFILITSIKINLGLKLNLKNPSDSLSYINSIANLINNSILLEIFNYINDNEKELFIYNLDKKFFCLNLFIPLENYYE